jgi:hypothetical protein
LYICQLEEAPASFHPYNDALEVLIPPHPHVLPTSLEMFDPNTVILRSSVVLSFVLLSLASTSGTITGLLAYPVHISSNNRLVPRQGGCGIAAMITCFDGEWPLAQ